MGWLSRRRGYALDSGVGSQSNQLLLFKQRRSSTLVKVNSYVQSLYVSGGLAPALVVQSTSCREERGSYLNYKKFCFGKKLWMIIMDMRLKIY